MRAMGVLLSVFVVAFCGSPSCEAEVVRTRENGACRLYDSRGVGGFNAGSKVSSTTVQTQDATLDVVAYTQGSISYNNQGGQTGCKVPSFAVAAEVNLVSFEPMSGGFGRLWPFGQPEPLSSSINVNPATVNESTGLAVRLGTDGQLAWHSIFTGHLIVDLTGWREPDGPAGRVLGISTPPGTIPIMTAEGKIVTVFPGSDPYQETAWDAALLELQQDQWVSFPLGQWRSETTFEAFSLP